jgi:hypothetical protein
MIYVREERRNRELAAVVNSSVAFSVVQKPSKCYVVFGDMC